LACSPSTRGPAIRRTFATDYRLVKVEAARSLQPADLAQGNRYQFAHGSLLEQTQLNEDLNDPEFVDRIHQWADSWRAAGWPYAGSGENVTPQYLLDTYPSTLTEDPQRLADLVSDAGWLEAAVLAWTMCWSTCAPSLANASTSRSTA